MTTAATEVKPWDFSHVLDLVNSLSYHETSATVTRSRNEQEASKNESQYINQESHASNAGQQENKDEKRGLGDFSRLWSFLGTPAESSDAAGTVYTTDRATPSRDLNLDDSIWDTKYQTPLSHNTISDEEQGGDTVSDSSLTPETPTLTKSQRKKRNRRERRAKEAALAEEEEAERPPKALTYVSEPEPRTTLSKTPAKPQILRIVDTTPKNKYDLRPRDSSGKAICESDRANAISLAVARVDAAKKAGTNTANPKSQVVDSTNKPHLNQTLPRRQSNPTLRQPSKSITLADDVLRMQSNVQNLLSTPSKANNLQLVPSTVAPHPNGIPHASLHAQSLPKHGTLKKNYATSIAPMTVRSGEDRHWALLLKLIADFHEDRKHLISPMNLTTHNNDKKGIHVFVDASNIFIGFNDQLKRSRGIPWHVQVPSVGLSFDALALLMERRRPVAKRVLVGSTPHLPAFDKAKAVGYECNILEKVYKARELTERQIYFKELDNAYRYRKRAKAPPANNVATVNGKSDGSGSGSETNAPQYAPARMIEQGVDEILHLKILESIVDTDVPSTIVLATGDAARAEYSEGFMAMAERALKKGWIVELVSWSKNISAMYTRREWAEAWGQRFRIVTLDDYAEELLDM